MRPRRLEVTLADLGCRVKPIGLSPALTITRGTGQADSHTAADEARKGWRAGSSPPASLAY